MTVLTVLLILYCILHSVLAEPPLFKKIYYKWWFRIFYVAQSIILLIPILYVYYSLPSDSIIDVHISVKIILNIIFAAGLLFGIYAARSYDNWTFFGVNQFFNRVKKGEKDFKEHLVFHKEGALRYVRHPYYFAGLLLVWGRVPAYRDIPLNVVFTLYFVFGAVNEERKLKKQFGNEYKNYMKEVPMLIPFTK